MARHLLYHCMSKSDQVEVIRHKYELLSPLMNERMRRQWAACEAMSFPRGGFALVAEATGLSRTTLWAGKRELQPRGHLPPEDRPPERIRRIGSVGNIRSNKVTSLP